VVVQLRRNRRGGRGVRRAIAGRGDRQRDTPVVIWAENRAEWIFALWGCLLEGVVLVPIDYRASADFLRRVAGIVDARAILVGDTPEASALEGRRARASGGWRSCGRRGGGP
jgi:acyl-CoA synthetase (AMP-forming)/AMP-acid ligase II